MESGRRSSCAPHSWLHLGLCLQGGWYAPRRTWPGLLLGFGPGRGVGREISSLSLLLWGPVPDGPLSPAPLPGPPPRCGVGYFLWSGGPTSSLGPAAPGLGPPAGRSPGLGHCSLDQRVGGSKSEVHISCLPGPGEECALEEDRGTPGSFLLISSRSGLVGLSGTGKSRRLNL